METCFLLLLYNEIIAQRLNYVFLLSKPQFNFYCWPRDSLLIESQILREWNVIFQLPQFRVWVQPQVITSYSFVYAHESLHVGGPHLFVEQ